jgi:nitroreductase
MAPTSFGLQPFRVYHVTDAVLRKTIQAAAYGQPQVVDASHLFVFCSRTDIANRIDEYLDIVASGDGEAKEELALMRQMLTGATASRSPEQLAAWTARQAYIALGFGLAACAELAIDSCPMEGFDAAKVGEILGVPATETVLVFLAIGYRAEGPARPKVRFSRENLVSIK